MKHVFVGLDDISTWEVGVVLPIALSPERAQPSLYRGATKGKHRFYGREGGAGVFAPTLLEPLPGPHLRATRMR